jgi:hypothetical protein
MFVPISFSYKIINAQEICKTLSILTSYNSNKVLVSHCTNVLT